MWFRETVFCCFSLLWNKSWEQKDQRTLKLVTLATVLAVSNADQRRGNIVLKRLESYYQLSNGLSNLIGQIFMGGILKEQLLLRVFRVSKKSAKCKDQPKNPLQERKSTTLSIQQLARPNWVLKIFFSFLKIDFLSTLSVQCWSSSRSEGGVSGHGYEKNDFSAALENIKLLHQRQPLLKVYGLNPSQLFKLSNKSKRNVNG